MTARSSWNQGNTVMDRPRSEKKVRISNLTHSARRRKCSLILVKRKRGGLNSKQTGCSPCNGQHIPSECLQPAGEFRDTVVVRGGLIHCLNELPECSVIYREAGAKNL